MELLYVRGRSLLNCCLFQAHIGHSFILSVNQLFWVQFIVCYCTFTPKAVKRYER